MDQNDSGMSVSDAQAPSQDDRQWAMFGHLSALTGVLTGGLGNILGPLVIWLVKKETSPFAADQAKEALNFNITLFIVGVMVGVAGGLFTVVTLGLGALLVVPVALLLAIAWLVLTIIAAIKANDGVAYRYPFTLRLVK
jgi:hypothetical protein